MKLKRLVAALLAAVLMMTMLTGCAPMLIWGTLGGLLYEKEKMQETTSSPFPEEGETEERDTADTTRKSTAQVGYFPDDVFRGNEDFSDITYEHYDLTKLDKLLDQVTEMASSGGTRDDFTKLDNQIYGELTYIYTLDTVIDLQYSDDPTDKSVSQECLYTDDLCTQANGKYWTAMSAMALSDNSDLMGDSYADWQIDKFRNAPDASDGEDALFSQESKLEQKYYSLMAADPVNYDSVLDDYVELVKVRQQIAAAEGADSYADYAYSKFARNYTPADAQTIWDVAKNYFVPLMQEYGYNASVQVSGLYDAADIDCSEQTILDSMAKAIPQISDEAYEAFSFMRTHGLYDIGSSAAKMDTGFTTTLYYYNEPFIFNAAKNNFTDYTDMFHEFGHYLNAYYTVSDPIFGVSDNDLAELQSQGMEILFIKYYGDIFGKQHANDVSVYTLMNMIYSVIDGAMYDEFQQEVFAEQDLTADKVQEIFKQVYAEYGYQTYDGYENSWMDVEHNFSYPLYYISYSVSAISALELFSIAKDSSYDEAKDKYLRAAAMDGEMYCFSDALEEAGLSDVFDPATSQHVTDSVAAFLAQAVS